MCAHTERAVGIVRSCHACRRTRSGGGTRVRGPGGHRAAPFPRAGRHTQRSAGVLTTARHLVETGALDSDVIYPSVLTQKVDKDYLYMPGYYLVLASGYAAFGFGTIPSILPSMAAHIVATIALFFGVNKVFGKDVATVAALVFAFLPANLAYAITAMVEPTLAAAVLVSLAIFIYLPAQTKAVVGPLLLAIPMFFRETGLVVGIPFVLMILFNQRGDQARAFHWSRGMSAALFVVLTALVATAVLKSDLSAGRPSLEPLIIVSNDEQTIYNDAYVLQRVRPDAQEWLTAPVVKVVSNARQLAGIFTGSARALLDRGVSGLTGAGYLEVVSLGLMLAGLPLSALAVIRRPRDPLLVGGLGLVGVTLLAILGLYFVRHFQAVRILLIGVPFECIAFGVLLSSLPRLPRKVTYVVAGLTMACGVGLTVAALHPTDVERAETQRHLEFMQRIGHDKSLVLVTPSDLPFDYLYTNYPVRWSFVPVDRQTLRLLNASYPVGTIILESGSTETELTADDLVAEGLNLVETMRLDGHEYAVYKRTSG